MMAHLRNKPLPRGGQPASEEELLVFGYSCRVFRDDERASELERGEHLIPWMGHAALLIDRYDCRGHLSSLTEHDADNVEVNGVPMDGQSDEQRSQEEMELDAERYHDLTTGAREEEIYHEEEMKRLQASIGGGGAEVAMNYDEYNPEQPTEDDHAQAGREEEVDLPFTCPANLKLPRGLNTPETQKQHSVIERTAVFVRDQGAQMEIVIKAKQSSNVAFDFLNVDHRLNDYYKYILKLLREGKYVPEIAKAEDDGSDSDSDSDGGYLHPSLMASTRPAQPPTSPKEAKPVKEPSYKLGQESDVYSQLYNNLSALREASLAKEKERVDALRREQEVRECASPARQAISSEEQARLWEHFYREMGLDYDHLRRSALPPPPDVAPVVDKMAEYVVRNGPEFEVAMSRQHPEQFGFVLAHHPYHPYYRMKLYIGHYHAYVNRYIKERDEAASRYASPAGQRAPSSPLVVGSPAVTSSNGHSSPANGAGAVAPPQPGGPGPAGRGSEPPQTCDTVADARSDANVVGEVVTSAKEEFRAMAIGGSEPPSLNSKVISTGNERPIKTQHLASFAESEAMTTGGQAKSPLSSVTTAGSVVENQEEEQEGTKKKINLSNPNGVPPPHDVDERRRITAMRSEGFPNPKNAREQSPANQINLQCPSNQIAVSEPVTPQRSLSSSALANTSLNSTAGYSLTPYGSESEEEGSCDSDDSKKSGGDAGVKTPRKPPHHTTGPIKFTLRERGARVMNLPRLGDNEDTSSSEEETPDQEAADSPSPTALSSQPANPGPGGHGKPPMIINSVPMMAVPPPPLPSMNELTNQQTLPQQHASRIGRFLDSSTPGTSKSSSANLAPPSVVTVSCLGSVQQPSTSEAAPLDVPLPPGSPPRSATDSPFDDSIVRSRKQKAAAFLAKMKKSDSESSLVSRLKVDSKLPKAKPDKSLSRSRKRPAKESRRRRKSSSDNSRSSSSSRKRSKRSRKEKRKKKKKTVPSAYAEPVTSSRAKRRSKSSKRKRRKRSRDSTSSPD